MYAAVAKEALSRSKARSPKVQAAAGGKASAAVCVPAVFPSPSGKARPRAGLFAFAGPPAIEAVCVRRAIGEKSAVVPCLCCSDGEDSAPVRDSARAGDAGTNGKRERGYLAEPEKLAYLLHGIVDASGVRPPACFRAGAGPTQSGFATERLAERR